MNPQRIWTLLAKKINGACSEEELLEFNQLLRDNPDAQFAYEIFRELWDQPDQRDPGEQEELFKRHVERLAEAVGDFIAADPLHQESYNKHLVEEPGTPVKNKNRILTGIFGLLLLLLGAGWFFHVYLNSSGKGTGKAMPAQALNMIYTRLGSRTQILLPDGTQVWLNAGSKITYDNNFSDQLEREVSLTGEAYFDVAHRQNQPFIIHTSQLDIRVLGTAFNVRAYPGDKATETTLIRGSIEVSFHENPSRKIILRPYEKMTVYNNHYQLSRIQDNKSVPEQPLANIPEFSISHTRRDPLLDSGLVETSWMQGKLVFRREDFGELARQMERKYGVIFHFKDQSLKQEKFTGIFTNESVEKALNALKIAKPFHYRLEDGQVDLYR
ncbi:MAG: FecR family protein [Chitinophagaceae bacterium]